MQSFRNLESILRILEFWTSDSWTSFGQIALLLEARGIQLNFAEKKKFFSHLVPGIIDSCGSQPDARNYGKILCLVGWEAKKARWRCIDYYCFNSNEVVFVSLLDTSQDTD